MSDKICYCFGLTESDIVFDLQKHSGHSTIMDKILKAKQAGECRCAQAHPESR